MSGRARPDEPLAPWCQAALDGCWGRASQRHHRKLRKHGGTDDPANTIDICIQCHTTIHANPKQSYRDGLLVMSHENPAMVRVLGKDWP